MTISPGDHLCKIPFTDDRELNQIIAKYIKRIVIYDGIKDYGSAFIITLPRSFKVMIVLYTFPM